MEFFNHGKAVRLKSHLDKYLVADDDQETVRQSRREGASRRARWHVELVEGNAHVIRLKSHDGLYLTASDEAYLLGMTGKKVVLQASANASVEWEPIREGYSVKLRAKGGKFLRANGATPPWRNSVTHDLPHRTATQDWVMWDVDEVDVSVLEDEYLPRLSNASSNLSDSSAPNSPGAVEGRRKSFFSMERRRSSLASDRSVHPSGREDGMELFTKAKAVRLQSHLGKYLVADDDEATVRQSRNGASRNARWTVEFVEGKRDRLRLKSCHGLYLTAAEEQFLLGMTGKKVLQTRPGDLAAAVEWQPVKEGNSVKLMTERGKFLRANGSSPPWRNSVTHDVPQRTATQSWVLWGVDIVDITLSDPGPGWISPASSFSSVVDDYLGSPDTGSPVARGAGAGNMSMKQISGIEFFNKARSVRLKSYHNKYLTADSDEEHVIQDRSGSKKSVKWEVEFVEGSEEVIRLKSCYGKYLKAEDEEYLLGVTGRRVSQSLPRKLDSSVEWEPVRDGMLVKLKTRYGNYLRANGGLPPWRNSITHDIPHRHHGWTLWEVDVVEIRPESPPRVVAPPPAELERSNSVESDVDLSSTFNLRSSSVNMSGEDCYAKKSEGRLIYYSVADDDGNFSAEQSFQFKGQGLEDLSEKLEELTDLEDIILCSKNIVNGKLYPLRLALPPNNATMHVVVVPPTSTVANEFMPPAPTST
ncbi:uncharacterized protein LOC125188839 isoform X2 [Salvia hispanica]|uniref:uncharacterized protein LOC125188839 isoform X2 n=1 Tax=Salvia hispanica TaxID=49212 RepID=UPI002009C3CF|nr:uncharacterized protein LOC125188839 isoform X2 [Salvia hispanica]